MNWKVGKQKSVVVSDTKVQNTNFPVPPNPVESQDEYLDYYGGYLICESVGNEDHAQLIAAAPDLLESLIDCYEVFKALEEVGVLKVIDVQSNVFDNSAAAIEKATNGNSITNRSILEVIKRFGYELSGYGFKKVTTENTHWITVFGEAKDIQLYGYFTEDPECDKIYDSGIIRSVSPRDLSVLISVYLKNHD